MIGPKDHWQVELESTSKSGLIALIRLQQQCHGDRDRDLLLANARWAKRIGRQIDLMSRIDQYLADPRGEAQRSMRKSAAAKKAARRRKRERKAA